MAEEEATRGRQSKTPISKPSRALDARPMDAALNLLAGQHATRRSNETQNRGDEDVTLGESSMNRGQEEMRPSVLDAGAKHPSYVFTEPKVEPPIAGGGLMTEPAMELERARAAEERMRQTQAEFLGESEQRAPSTREAEARARPSETIPEPIGAEAETTEEEDVDIESGRLRDTRAQQQIKQLAQQQAREQAQLIQKQVRKKILDSIKIGNGALSIETLAITLLINLALWNIQGINKYLWKSDLIPSQSNAEDFVCTTCNFFVCFNGLFCSPPCFLGPVLLVLGTMFYFAKEYAEPIFKIFNIFT